MDTVSDRKKDLFYKESRRTDGTLKRRPAEKEERHYILKDQCYFNVIIGLVILLGVILPSSEC